MPLTYLDQSADSITVADVLRREGAVAVTGLITPDLADKIAAEFRPQLDADGLKSRGIFNNNLTKRYDGALQTAPSSAELVDHEVALDVLDDILQESIP